MSKSRMPYFIVCALIMCSIFTATFIFCGEHEVAAAQTKPSYEITVTSGENGQITPVTRSFKEGKNAVFTVKPFKGFKIDTIAIDGVNVDLSKIKKTWNPYEYVFKKVAAAHTISATFKADMKISPSVYILKIGEAKNFYVTDSRGKKLPNAIISWATNDQTIAAVSDNGLVTANGEGTINVFATYEGMIVEDVTPVIVDPLTIKVVGPPQRPAELIEVNPMENETYRFGSCDVNSSESNYGAPGMGPIGAAFRFEVNDILNSAQLFLDGADVTSDSTVSNSTYTHADGSTTTDSYIFYRVSYECLSGGIHEVTVKGTSKAGKEVSYTWSFAKK